MTALTRPHVDRTAHLRGPVGMTRSDKAIQDMCPHLSRASLMQDAECPCLRIELQKDINSPKMSCMQQKTLIIWGLHASAQLPVTLQRLAQGSLNKPLEGD